jgi:hypothetical protein
VSKIAEATTTSQHALDAPLLVTAVQAANVHAHRRVGPGWSATLTSSRKVAVLPTIDLRSIWRGERDSMDTKKGFETASSHRARS